MVCNKCMNYLERMAKEKRRLVRLIEERESDQMDFKPRHLGLIWEILDSNINTLEVKEKAY